MSKVKPSTKEQLIHYLLNNISLGTYDRKFLVNLETIYLTTQKPVTTNQSELLSKIILRYNRQLAKQELSVDEANTLPWTRQPIPSLPEFTETHLILVDDELILRSPYKAAFIKEFRKLDVHGKWEYDDRLWRIPASTHTLFKVKKCVEHHYTTVNYCEKITNLLQQVAKYKEDDIWNPTIVHTNGMFYVSPITEPLANSIANIPLDDDLKHISRIVASGVDVSDSALCEYRKKYSDKELEFATSSIVKIEHLDSELVDLILSVKPDLVIFIEYLGAMKPYLKSVKDKLKEYNIKTITPLYSNLQIDMNEHDYIMIVETGLSLKQQILPYASKLVQVINNKPIDIK